MDVTDVRSIVEQAAAECRRQPDTTVADVLVAMAREDGKDPVGVAYVAYAFSFYRGGRHSDYEFMSHATWKTFKREFVATGNEICFGEINGKHSDVSCAWHEVTRTIVRRGWRADEAADVAIAMLLLPVGVDQDTLADIVAHLEDSDAESSSDEASNKRAECEDAEVPAAKRVAVDTD